MKHLLPLAILTFATPVFANDTVHIRGTIDAAQGNVVTVQTEDGARYDVEMAEDYTLIVYQDISITDIGMGDFLSIPSVPAPTGEKQAMSINVFPEDMRGTAEGEQAWDLTEDSLMTNATVGEVLNAADGTVLLVAHEGKLEPILVPAGTEVTRFAPVDDRRLEVGDQTVIFAEGDGDKITSGLAGISEDGSLPPV